MSVVSFLQIWHLKFFSFPVSKLFPTEGKQYYNSLTGMNFLQKDSCPFCKHKLELLKISCQ